MPQGGEGLRGGDSCSSPRGQRDWVDFSALWLIRDQLYLRIKRDWPLPLTPSPPEAPASPISRS